MWRMQSGNRALTEAEWVLFSTGLGLLRDDIEDDIRNQTDTETGILVFDRLTPEQKLALMADTAFAMREPATPAPRHTAANEGTIAAVFENIRFLLTMELDNAALKDDCEKPTDIRQMLRAIFDPSVEREDRLPDETDSEPTPWDWLLEEFEDRIFWDNDFAMEGEFLDLPPDEVCAKLKQFGIDPDYYLTVPDDPSAAGLIAARQILGRLLGLPIPDEDGGYAMLKHWYHGLTIGPCSPEEKAHAGNIPWVEVCWTPELDFDCDFPTWKASFSEALPTSPFTLAPVTAGVVYELPSGLSVECRGDVWVVRDENGWYWCELVENCWNDSDFDEHLTFSTEAEAKSACTQANCMYVDREMRYEKALVQLGIGEEL